MVTIAAGTFWAEVRARRSVVAARRVWRNIVVVEY
jgi:hypothetical protein